LGITGELMPQSEKKVFSKKENSGRSGEKKRYSGLRSTVVHASPRTLALWTEKGEKYITLKRNSVDHNIIKGAGHPIDPRKDLD